MRWWHKDDSIGSQNYLKINYSAGLAYVSHIHIFPLAFRRHNCIPLFPSASPTYVSLVFPLWLHQQQCHALHDLCISVFFGSTHATCTNMQANMKRTGSCRAANAEAQKLRQSLLMRMEQSIWPNSKCLGMAGLDLLAQFKSPIDWATNSTALWRICRCNKRNFKSKTFGLLSPKAQAFKVFQLPDHAVLLFPQSCRNPKQIPIVLFARDRCCCWWWWWLGKGQV